MAFDYIRGIEHRARNYYMEELKSSLSEASVVREVELEMGGRIDIPLYEFEPFTGDKWIVEDYDVQLNGEEVCVQLSHESGGEEAEVIIDCQTRKILKADVTQVVENETVF